jgi:hypothetical protein
MAMLRKVAFVMFTMKNIKMTLGKIAIATTIKAIRVKRKSYSIVGKSREYK